MGGSIILIGQSPTQVGKSDRKVKYSHLSEDLLLWDRSDIVRAQKRGKESEYFGPFKSPSISQSDYFGLPR